MTTTTGAGSASTTTTTTTGTGGGGGGTTTTTATLQADPNHDGPYTITELDDSMTVVATGDKQAIHCAYPTAGPSAGPYPVVVVAHGFQLPSTQYYGYVRRLASFGYVALTADFPAGFVTPDHVKGAKDLAGALDWAAAKAELAGKANASLAGVTGHSLGGKLSFLAATLDPRFRAAITLDPVDTSSFCDLSKCPDVSALMGTLSIPTGVVGETTDAGGGFGQACAPKADNFATFYAGANSPSLSVEVLGANHMSFLDDVSSCGFTCGVCQAAKADNAVVNGLSKAFVVAFYERWLRGDASYDDYLTGATAKTRYVDTGLATIESK